MLARAADVDASAAAIPGIPEVSIGHNQANSQSRFLVPTLRVGDDIRVFYDVSVDTVAVLAIVSKAEANEWLERYGESDEEGGAL